MWPSHDYEQRFAEHQHFETTEQDYHCATHLLVECGIKVTGYLQTIAKIKSTNEQCQFHSDDIVAHTLFFRSQLFRTLGLINRTNPDVTIDLT
jgi:hypothetical protein